MTLMIGAPALDVKFKELAVIGPGNASEPADLGRARRDSAGASWQRIVTTTLLTAGAGAGARGGFLLLEQFGDHRFELAAGLDRNELAVLVDQEHAWESS